MSSLRTQRIAEFRDDIASGKRESDDTLYRALYGLPADLQIELARTMTLRYLPIFQMHHPDVKWPEIVLAGLDAYCAVKGKSFPAYPDDLLPADGTFLSCLDALAFAWSYARKNEQGRLTQACCVALMDAVHARATNVWQADDPEALHAFDTDDHEALYGRTSFYNVASRAVRQREWLVVADWLDEHDIARFPDTEDEEREEWLSWWKDREYVL